MGDSQLFVSMPSNISEENHSSISRSHKNATSPVTRSLATLNVTSSITVFNSSAGMTAIYDTRGSASLNATSCVSTVNANRSMVNLTLVPPNGTSMDKGDGFPDVTTPLVILLSICVVGVLNNILTGILLHDDIFKGVALRVHYLSLAVFDSLLLLHMLASIFAKFYYKIQLESVGQVCAISLFFGSMLNSMSSWLTAVVSIERALCTWRPLQAHLSTPSKAKIIVLTLLGVNLLIWSPSIWMTDFTSSGCQLRPEFKHYPEPILFVSAAIVAPVLILTISYVAMITGYIKMKRHAPPSSVSNGNQAARLTATSIGICTAYIVLNFPTAFDAVFNVRQSPMRQKGIEITAYMPVFLVMRSLNHCSNLYIYLGTSTQFRQALKNLWCYIVSKIQTCNN